MNFVFSLVISVNNSAAHLPLSSSDCGSASECESGELSSDEYPSEIKIKPLTISSHCQENHFDSTHEMGTLAQLLNHSFPVQKDASMKFVSKSRIFKFLVRLYLDMNQIYIVMKFLIIVYVHLHQHLELKILVVYQNIYLLQFNDKNHVMNNDIMPMHN